MLTTYVQDVEIVGQNTRMTFGVTGQLSGFGGQGHRGYGHAMTGRCPSTITDAEARGCREEATTKMVSLCCLIAGGTSRRVVASSCLGSVSRSLLGRARYGGGQFRSFRQLWMGLDRAGRDTVERRPARSSQPASRRRRSASVSSHSSTPRALQRELRRAMRLPRNPHGCDMAGTILASSGRSAFCLPTLMWQFNKAREPT
jgi:hypothetical protein